MVRGEKFYITTPLYYVNDIPHLGHLFEAIGIDVQARFRRLLGHDVFFLSGTDEHGGKIEAEARRRGTEPQQLVDEIAEAFKTLWRDSAISYDYFIRTTEARHRKSVIKFFKAVYDNGDIYKSSYEGWYCTPCETFWTESHLQEGRLCPECGRPTNRNREEAYFFRLSKYQKWLLDYIESHPDFIKPQFRANEMVQSFLKPGLSDLCISRTTVKWGIPLPLDPKHVVYVWFDALINYVTGIGYSDDEETFNHYWPANIHIVGKDILKFHTTIWPAMLKSAGLEPPGQVFGHGFVTVKEEKMSKSKGNIIDPYIYINKYRADALRYFLLREISYSHDGMFSEEHLHARYNSDLANDLGNLLSRVLTMVNKYQAGELQRVEKYGTAESNIIEIFDETLKLWEQANPEFEYNQVLAKIWDSVNALNKYVNDKQPWTLAKDATRKQELQTCLYTLCEGLRLLAVLIYPFMPTTAGRIWQQLGIERELLEVPWAELRRWAWLPDHLRIGEQEPLFPRLS